MQAGLLSLSKGGVSQRRSAQLSIVRMRGPLAVRMGNSLGLMHCLEDQVVPE